MLSYINYCLDTSIFFSIYWFLLRVISFCFTVSCKLLTSFLASSSYASSARFLAFRPSTCFSCYSKLIILCPNKEWRRFIAANFIYFHFISRILDHQIKALEKPFILTNKILYLLSRTSFQTQKFHSFYHDVQNFMDNNHMDFVSYSPAFPFSKIHHPPTSLL